MISQVLPCPWTAYLISRLLEVEAVCVEDELCPSGPLFPRGKRIDVHIHSFRICVYHSAVGQCGTISLILFQLSQRLLDQTERWKCMYGIAHLLPLTMNALSATALTSSTLIVASLIHFPGSVSMTPVPSLDQGPHLASSVLTSVSVTPHSIFVCDWENISFPWV